MIYQEPSKNVCLFMIEKMKEEIKNYSELINNKEKKINKEEEEEEYEIEEISEEEIISDNPKQYYGELIEKKTYLTSIYELNYVNCVILKKQLSRGDYIVTPVVEGLLSYMDRRFYEYNYREGYAYGLSDLEEKIKEERIILNKKRKLKTFEEDILFNLIMNKIMISEKTITADFYVKNGFLNCIKYLKELNIKPAFEIKENDYLSYRRNMNKCFPELLEYFILDLEIILAGHVGTEMEVLLEMGLIKELINKLKNTTEVNLKTEILKSLSNVEDTFYMFTKCERKRRIANNNRNHLYSTPGIISYSFCFDYEYSKNNSKLGSEEQLFKFDIREEEMKVDEEDSNQGENGLKMLFAKEEEEGFYDILVSLKSPKINFYSSCSFYRNTFFRLME